MNNKAVTISLLMAGIAVYIVYSYVSSIEKNAEKKYGTQILVVTAKRDIKEMESINETLLELKRVPKRFLEPAAISYAQSDNEEDAVNDMKSLVGNVAIVPIKEGEQVTFNKIIEPGLRTGLSPQVTPGRRAVSIAVNETSSVSKLIKPGDRVDVIAVFNLDGKKTSRIAKTILQDVAVLAVGRYVTNNVPRKIERDPGSNEEKVTSLASYDGFSSVTIEVEPSQAEMLTLTKSLGSETLTLALRNNDDTDRTKTPGTSVWDVLGADANKARALMRVPARSRARK